MKVMGIIALIYIGYKIMDALVEAIRIKRIRKMIEEAEEDN